MNCVYRYGGTLEIEERSLLNDKFEASLWYMSTYLKKERWRLEGQFPGLGFT